MAERQTEPLGTIYRVVYDDGARLFFTPADYARELTANRERVWSSDSFTDARFEWHDGGWWMLTGVSDQGPRMDLADSTEREISTLALTPAVARQLGIGQDIPDRGDFDVYYDPEAGTVSVQAEYGDRADLTDAEAAEPVERHRLRNLADRIRAWFQHAQDQGMGR
jgi:hypothetical protein